MYVCLLTTEVNAEAGTALAVLSRGVGGTLFIYGIFNN